MPDGKGRMIKKHPRSGEPHDLADLLTHFRFITVNAAVAAESFFIHKRASPAAKLRIISQLQTGGAHLS